MKTASSLRTQKVLIRAVAIFFAYVGFDAVPLKLVKQSTLKDVPLLLLYHY
jgi:hypothetical protein